MQFSNSLPRLHLMLLSIWPCIPWQSRERQS